MSRRTPSVCKALAVALVACVALGGIASDAQARSKKNKAERQAKKDTTVDLLQLTWPEAPETPRIRALQTYSTEKHLGRTPTRREQFLKWFAGAAPPRSHIYQPMDIVVSDDGKRFFVSDFGQLAVFAFDTEQQALTQIGRNRPLNRPFGLALDADENLYISEQGARRITVLDRDFKPLRRIEHPDLVRPADLAIDRDRGLLYVADPAMKASEDHSVKVFDLEGNLLRRVGNGKGSCEGCLLFPTYVEVDNGGNVYVTSTLLSRIDKFDSDGNHVRQFGERGTSYGMFDKPKGVAIDSFGNVYVVDSGWSNVQIFNQDGKVLLFFGARGLHPGLLKNPTGIAIDGSNRIYVADYLNYRVSTYQLVNTTAEDSQLVAETEAPGTDDSGAADEPIDSFWEEDE